MRPVVRAPLALFALSLFGGLAGAQTFPALATLG